MNNKGFAITGILYTIFALFVLVIFAALININFKRKTLSAVAAKLEDELAMEAVALDSSFEKIDDNYYAKYDGKYIFELSYEYGKKGESKTIILDCTAYLKEGDVIPTTAGENFTLIPTDCNYPEYQIGGFESSDRTSEENKMFLKEVYKFKDSD